jgi:hypothetical protein
MFAAASIGKTFVAAAIVALARDGAAYQAAGLRVATAPIIPVDEMPVKGTESETETDQRSVS